MHGGEIVLVRPVAVHEHEESPTGAGVAVGCKRSQDVDVERLGAHPRCACTLISTRPPGIASSVQPIAVHAP